MVRHIVVWDFKEELTAEEKSIAAVKMKAELEKLKNEVEGVVEINVIIEPLSTSNAEVMLDSTFENEQTLASYQIHPKHNIVAQYIKSVTMNRRCMDYTL